MAGAGATRAILIAPAVRSRGSARVSACPKRRFQDLERPDPNPKPEGRNPKEIRNPNAENGACDKQTGLLRCRQPGCCAPGRVQLFAFAFRPEGFLRCRSEEYT